MAFAVFHAYTFERYLARMPKDFKEWLEKVEDQLTENPYVGDQIRVNWFREKKKGKFRVYYLIYEELQTVYLVGISSKKDQQTTINTIWLLLDNFKEDIYKLINK